VEKRLFSKHDGEFARIVCRFVRGVTRVDPPTVDVHRAARLVTIEGPRDAGAGAVGGLHLRGVMGRLSGGLGVWPSSCA
jgi:hypothetical protein